MDIGSFTHSKTATINVTDPLGNPTDIVVKIYGKETKEYRQRTTAILRNFATASDDERGARLILAAVESWENVEHGGQAVDPHSEKAVELCQQDQMQWFVEQIASALYDRSLFFRKRGSS